MKISLVLFTLAIGLAASCSSDSKSSGKSFSVGGTVTGLSGTLVIQNNGADDLTLTADGTFTFATKIDDEGTYDVEVDLPPTGMNCQISGGAGTISGANVNNVVITCSSRSWTVPIGLTDNISDDASSVSSVTPSVALNQSGETLIVWVQGGSGTSQIYKAEYTNGEWLLPVNAYDTVSPKGQNATNPQVAMNRGGDAIIVWQQSDGTNNQIFFTERRGGEWTTPSGVTDNISPDGTEATSPKVALADNGDAVILWTQDIDTSGTNNYRVFMSEYRLGAWVHPVDLNAYIGPKTVAANASTDQIDIAMSKTGCTILGWTQSDGTGTRGYSAHYLADATWNFPTTFAEHFILGGASVSSVSVGIEDSCDGIIVWSQSDGSKQQIYKRQLVSGTWTVPANQADNLSVGGTDAAVPSVAMNNSGDAVISWRQVGDVPDSFQSMFRSSVSGTTFTNPATLADAFSPGSNVNVTYPPVAAIDANGEALIAWIQTDSSTTDDQVFISQYRDGSWLNPIDLDDNISPDVQDTSFVRAAASRNGDMVVVWLQSDGTRQQLFLAEYR